MFQTLSIFSLKKHGYLNGYKDGVLFWADKYSRRVDRRRAIVKINDNKAFMRLLYQTTNQYGSVKKFDYKIHLTTTLCNYGGKRYWFMCPLLGCHRKVGTLYFGSIGCGCNQCYQITYGRNQTRTIGWAGIEKRWKLEEKLEDMEMKMLDKRRWYGARFTKFYRKLNRLHWILDGHPEWYDRMNVV